MGRVKGKWGSHVRCWRCWEQENPGRDPVIFKNPPLETCCKCRVPTRSGIYVRANPEWCHCGDSNEEETA